MNHHKMDGCIYYRNFLPALYMEAGELGMNKLFNRIQTREVIDEKTGKVTALEYNFGIIQWSDAVVFNRYYSQEFDHIIRAAISAAKGLGKKIIYEADDDTINIPTSNPVSEAAIPAIPLTKHIIENADGIFVTTHRLGATLKEAVPNAKDTPLFVLPNSVETYRFENPRKSYRKNPDEIRIAWSGGMTHGADIKLMFDGLKRILKEYKNVKFVTLTSKSMHELMDFEHEWHPFVPTEDYPETLASLDVDIALIPLEDSIFNGGKSPIKWVEFSVIGAASVYSDVPPYSDYIMDGKTGIAVGKDNDWYTPIKKLVDDVKLRKELADAAQGEVYEKFNMEKNVLLWTNAYKKVIDSPKGGE